MLATSRAPLHLSAERELPVDPLPSQAAVELFVSRAAAAGREVEADATVAAVCRRLDNLPLALELAAARAKLLSPAALLERLDAALPLLSGGARDLPERQQTLRATIEWSHDLLDPEPRPPSGGCLSSGSFTLDAAEAVTRADLDQIAGLLDQSLLKPLGDDRFFLLETMREYARERLDLEDEDAEYALRHARHYLAGLEARASAPAGQRLAWFAAEEDNLRALLDELTARAPARRRRRSNCSAGICVRGAHTSSSASEWTRSSLRTACLKMHDPACCSPWPRPRSASETLRGRSWPPALPSRSSSREALITPSRFYSPRP